VSHARSSKFFRSNHRRKEVDEQDQSYYASDQIFHGSSFDFGQACQSVHITKLTAALNAMAGRTLASL
jgi:hypothetical protein